MKVSTILLQYHIYSNTHSSNVEKSVVFIENSDPNDHYLTNIQAVELSNNTILNNSDQIALTMRLSGSELTNVDCKISNSIIYGNGRGINVITGTETESDIFPKPDVSYCMLYDNNVSGTADINIQGMGWEETIECVSEDPKLNMFPNYSPDYPIYQPLWNSTTKSLAIDSGNPALIDADGSIRDIGAVRAVTHKVDNRTLDPNGFNWIAFPVFDDVFEDSEGYDADMFGYALSNIMGQNGPLEYLKTEDAQFPTQVIEVQLLSGGEYSGADLRIRRDLGYKVDVNSEVDLYIAGWKTPSTEQMYVKGEGHKSWLAYTLEESSDPRVALNPVLYNLKAVYTRHWCMTWVEETDEWSMGLDIDDPATLNYGDLVIVESRIDAPNSVFCWDGSEPTDPKYKLKVEFFKYNEEAEYIPVFVHLVDGDEPKEIGIKVDEVIKGAAVVKDGIAQINVYGIDQYDPETFDIVKYYDSNMQSANIPISKDEYIVVNSTGEIYNNVIDGSDYYIIDFNKNSRYLKARPKQFALKQNNPNPFNPITTINYDIDKECDVKLEIFNVKGQKVKTLLNERKAAGSYNIIWDGRNDIGASVSSGVYFYRLFSEDRVTTKKMLLMK